MAEIKLVFKPDYSEVNKAIQNIRQDIAKSLGNIKISIDSSGVQATQNLSSNLQKASSAAMEYDRRLDDVRKAAQALQGEFGKLQRIVGTTFSDETKQFTQAVAEFGRAGEEVRRVAIAFDEAGEATHSLVSGTEDVAAASKRAAREAAQAAKEKEKSDRQIAQTAKELDREMEKSRKERNAQFQKFEQEQREYEAEQHKKRVEEIRFEAQAQREIREEQERANKEREKAADTAVTLERQYSNLIRQIQNLKAQYPEGTFDAIEQQAREARDELRNLDKTTDNYADRVRELQGSYQGLQRDMANTREETKKLDRVTESFWMNIQKFARWYIGGNIVTKVIGGFRDALSTMKAVDTELANIQKVTDRTNEQMKATAEAAYDVASAYGVAAEDYLESVAEFAKAGFGDQSEQLAEIATKTQLVGDVTSSVANKFLIASNAAWKMNGDIATLNKTLDAANIIENNYATSIEKLAAGMPIVSSIAAQAGMTFEETIAALGTITSVTQETGTKAATALRALILNIIGAVGEYEDGIEITEESVKSLDGILQVYAKDALAAAKAAGTVINPMEAIAALAKASEEGLVNQAELFEVLSGLGGKLRTNQLTALVQNFGMMQEMLEKTRESAGSADKEISVMLDTWEAKSEILRNTWTRFISHLIDEGIIERALESITKLIDFLDSGAGRATLKIGALTYVVLGLSSGIGKLSENITKLLPLLSKLAPAASNLNTAISGIGGMGAAAGIAGIAVGATAATVAMYNALTVTEEEYQQATEDARSSFQKAKAEYDALLAKSSSLTDAEKERLITLNEQLDTLRKQEGTSVYQQYMDAYDPTNQLKNAAAVATQLQRDLFNQTQNGWLQQAEETKQKIREMADELQYYSDILGTDLPESGKYALNLLTNMIRTWDAEEEAAKKAAEETNKAADAEKNAGEQGGAAAPKVKTLTERMAEASEAATKYDTAIGDVITAMTDFGAGSIEVYNAMVKLEAEIPGSTDKLYDFSTATWKIDASMIASKADLLDFIDTQKQLEFSSAIAELESVAAAYWDIAGAAVAAMTNQQAQAQMSGVLALTGGGASQAHYDIVQSQLAGVKAQKAEWDAYIATLRARSGYRDDGSGGNGYTPKSEAPQNATDEELARLQSIVELRKAELAFLQASGASTEEIVAKYKEIQNALHDENERRRAIRAEMEAQGATEEELAEIDAQILATGTEWWNVQKEINEELEKTQGKSVDELERLQSIVSLRKAELQFLEASGASEDEINAKRKEIQAALHEEAEYKRQIRAEMEAQGAAEAELAKIDAEILALSTEWWEIQKDILATKQKLQDIDQTELNRLKGIVDYRKQELSFLIASGKSEDEINAKRKEIQASLHDQAEEMRRILAVMKEQGASEEEIRAYETSILALSTEWWNIQKEIEDSLERQKKLQQEMFETVKKTVDDYYAKILTDKQEELSLEEKILAVQKAQADLANAQKERTVRYYNRATGQWEWRANAKTVKSAEDALKKAQDDLNKYQKDQAWKAFKSAWEYVSDQIKAGAMTFREAYDYMYKAMKEIQDTYGVDLGFVLEDSIGGFKDLNYGIDGLTQEVADTLGASVGVLNEKLKEYEKAVGAFKNAFDQASEKVKNGEMSMEDAYSYLRDRAREIADKYGIDMTGALEEAIAGMDKTNMSIDELWKAVIINLMKVNSARWFDANEEERAYLHAQNEYLGSLIGATYDPSGYWYLNGSQLYGSQKGVDVSGKSGYGESTGSSSGGGSSGSGGGNRGVVASRTADGKFRLADGSVYATLEEAIAANAAMSRANGGGGKSVGYSRSSLYNGLSSLRDIFRDPIAWAQYSKLQEADEEYANRLDQLALAIASGAPQEDINALYNSLYSDSKGSLGYFGAYQGAGGTTGFVKAGYGDANGEYLLVIDGKLYNSSVSAGTELQDLWGNRWAVADDGHTLIALEPAWYDNGDGSTTPGYVYTHTKKLGEDIDRGVDGVVKAKTTLGAEDILAGKVYGASHDFMESVEDKGLGGAVAGVLVNAAKSLLSGWNSMMDLENNDLANSGAEALSKEWVETSEAISSATENVDSVVNNGDTYNFEGISLNEEQAKSTSIFDLAKMALGLGQYKGEN